MKAYIFMADGFEIIEAFAPIDVLKRCGAEVVTVSIKEDLFVESSQKNTIKTDTNINEINFKDADVIILPGGAPGYINLRENEKVVEIVKYFLENDRYVAAICGAPTLFATNNLALGKSLTAHSATQKIFKNTHKYTGTDLHIDGKLITGIGAGLAIDFGFLIAEQFYDNEIIAKAKKGMELS